MKRKICSLLLILCMVLGIMPMVASATEVSVPEGWYKVTVKVAPQDANVKFYSDSDATTEITENVYDDGIVGGYHQYTFVAQEGFYSYRAWEGEQSLGGMEFKVPIDDEYDSNGNLMGKGQVLMLRRMNLLTTSAEITKPEDYTVHLLPQDLKEAATGDNYVNENGNVVCPIMVNCGGNALTYNLVIDINGDLGNTYAVTPQQHLTFSSGNGAFTQTFSIGQVSWFTITAPAAAKVQMFNQYSNYNVKEIQENKKETLSDGAVKHYFATPGGMSVTYRVSMAGKVTRAGFTSSSNKNLVFTFGDSENPKSTQTTASRIDNKSMVNVNSQNNLKMAVGETFRLRSFRAGWQIINTDTSNIMIEPDFSYKIISGGENITMTPITDKCTGNAGSGEKCNWMDIKAVSQGTVVLEVSYDAIQIGGDTSYTGLFGACDPNGKSIIVIDIGETKASNTLEIKPQHSNYAWDADFDHVYFLEETADFSFTSNMSGTVELSTDLGKTWSAVDKNGSTYNATGLVNGNNLLRVTNGSNVQYQVVRAAKIKMLMANQNRTGDTIVAGDTVRIVFKGLYTPVPKMGGIYNPGFTASHKTIYSNPSNVSAVSTSTQYGFAKDNELLITFTEAGTFDFTKGYISSAVMGDPLGGHRLLTDSGRGVNFNARDASSNRSIMPDLHFEVIDMPEIKVTVNTNPEGATIQILDQDENIIQPQEDGTYLLNYGTYIYKLKKTGYVPEVGELTVGGDDNVTGEKTVTIDMRAVGGDIWDGKSKKKPATDENGVYQIGTGKELAWFAANHNSASAVLTADISMGGFGVKISNFSGTFDGNGHYLTDYYGTSALFLQPGNGAVIKNLGISGEVRGDAAFVSYSKDFGTVTIENCVNRASVTGTADVGGIVGNADHGYGRPNVINCYNAGTITGESGFTGGIVGYSDTSNQVYIKNCYNIGRTNGYGICHPAMGTNSNNYTLYGAAPNAGGTELAEDVLKTYGSTLGNAYLVNPTSYNKGYPILTWEEPRALEVAKAEFPVELGVYRDYENYTELAAAKRDQAIIDGNTAIAAASTLAEAQEALNQAKIIIDAIDPDETEVTVLLGDANGDGSVSIKDVMNLRKYLIDNTRVINMTNADLNSDNKVTIKDVLLLRKALLAD